MGASLLIGLALAFIVLGPKRMQSMLGPVSLAKSSFRQGEPGNQSSTGGYRPRRLINTRVPSKNNIAGSKILQLAESS